MIIFDRPNKSAIYVVQSMVIFRPERVEYEYQTTI